MNPWRRFKEWLDDPATCFMLLFGALFLVVILVGQME